jgi:CheY-like chemotaxis protein
MKQRLLLVDDDEVFLRPLHRTLELAGYEVLPVQSGEEALDTLKTEDRTRPDRQRLPGWQVALVRQIKADRRPGRRDDGLRTTDRRSSDAAQSRGYLVSPSRRRRCSS